MDPVNIDTDKMHYWLLGALVLTLGSVAFLGTIKLRGNAEAPTGMSHPPDTTVTSTVDPHPAYTVSTNFGAVAVSPGSWPRPVTPVFTAQPQTPVSLLNSGPAVIAPSIPPADPPAAGPHPVLIYLPATEVVVPTPQSDQSEPGQSGSVGSQVLRSPKLWLTSVARDERGEKVQNVAVRGGLSGSPGVSLYHVTLYNASPDSVWIAPARILFDDGGYASLYRWAALWSFCSDGVLGRRGMGPCYTPAPADAPAVELSPGVETTVPVFAESVEVRSSGLQTAAYQPPSRPRTLLFAVLAGLDSVPDAGDVGPLSARLQRLSDNTDALLQGKFGTYTLFQVPAPLDETPEALIRS